MDVCFTCVKVLYFWISHHDQLLYRPMPCTMCADYHKNVVSQQSSKHKVNECQSTIWLQFARVVDCSVFWELGIYWAACQVGCRPRDLIILTTHFSHEIAMPVTLAAASNDLWKLTRSMTAELINTKQQIESNESSCITMCYECVIVMMLTTTSLHARMLYLNWNFVQFNMTS